MQKTGPALKGSELSAQNQAALFSGWIANARPESHGVECVCGAPALS